MIIYGLPVEIFNVIFKFLPTNDILKMRELSKGIKAIVDRSNDYDKVLDLEKVYKDNSFAGVVGLYSSVRVPSNLLDWAIATYPQLLNDKVVWNVEYRPNLEGTNQGMRLFNQDNYKKFKNTNFIFHIIIVNEASACPVIINFINNTKALYNNISLSITVRRRRDIILLYDYLYLLGRALGNNNYKAINLQIDGYTRKDFETITFDKLLSIPNLYGIEFISSVIKETELKQILPRLNISSNLGIFSIINNSLLNSYIHQVFSQSTFVPWTLDVLDLTNTNMGPAIFKTLGNSRVKVRKLILSLNRLSGIHRCIDNIIVNLKQIGVQILELQQCELNNKDAKALIGHLHKSEVKELNIHVNTNIVYNKYLINLLRKCRDTTILFDEIQVPKAFLPMLIYAVINTEGLIIDGSGLPKSYKSLISNRLLNKSNTKVFDSQYVSIDNPLIKNSVGLALTTVSRLLLSNNYLTSLSLASKNIGDKGVELFKDCFANIKTLRTVNLAKTNITDKSIQLVESILSLPYLTYLNLCCNKFTDNLVQSLSNLRNNSIQKLILGKNNFSAKVLWYISNVIENFKSLSNLRISFNITETAPIGDDQDSFVKKLAYDKFSGLYDIGSNINSSICVETQKGCRIYSFRWRQDNKINDVLVEKVI